jgi:two-component system phosphate regulon sensor histidine kinase PhoR
MSEGVMAVSSDETVLSLNRSAAALLGIEEDTARGKFVLEVVRSAELRAIIQDLLRSRRPMQKEVRLWTQGDRVFKCNCITHSGTDDDPIRLLIVFDDVSRLRALEDLRRDFTANVSHEFKTPLSSIKGYLELLIEEPDAAGEQTRRFLQIVQHETERLESLIDSLLMLSRIELLEDAPGLTRVETAVRQILEKALLISQAEIEEKEIIANIDCDETLTADLNEELLITAMSSLIDNAVRYTPAGGVIEIGGMAEDDEIVLFVKDSGPGLPKGDFERLFQRFFKVRLKRNGKDGGPGLGLAIVKHVALAHGGSVEADNLDEGGSIFVIRIPARDSL